MGQITSIDSTDRLATRIEQRDPETALAELQLCVTDFNLWLRDLAAEYPGCMAIGGIVYGQVCGALVLTPSAGTCHFSPVAPQLARNLANLIANLYPEVRAEFETQFKFACEINRLKDEMEQVAAAAIKAARSEGV
jgi:hypothetical protein